MILVVGVIRIRILALQIQQDMLYLLESRMPVGDMI